MSKTSTITADTQATGYQYGSSTNAGPHAVSQVTLNGVSTTFSYDANGAITQYDYSTGPDTFIEYNAANQPTTIVVGTSLADTNLEGKDEFSYGPDGERYYKKSTYLDSGSVQQIEHTFYVGSFEEIVGLFNAVVTIAATIACGGNPACGAAAAAYTSAHSTYAITGSLSQAIKAAPIYRLLPRASN